MLLNDRTKDVPFPPSIQSFMTICHLYLFWWGGFSAQPAGRTGSRGDQLIHHSTERDRVTEQPFERSSGFPASERWKGPTCRTTSPASASAPRSATNGSTSATSTRSSRPPTRRRTVLILNANPNADALHPDADLPAQHRQRRRLPDRHRVQLRLLRRRRTAARPSTSSWRPARRPARPRRSARRSSPTPRSPSAPRPTSSRRATTPSSPARRSDAFFFDFDGIKNLFDTSGGRNFTAPHLGGESPWTGVDSNTEANVFSTVIELPTSELGADPEIRIWGRCSVRRDGELSTSTGPDTRRSAASSTPTTPRRSTTPASRSTIGSAGPTSSST